MKLHQAANIESNGFRSWPLFARKTVTARYTSLRTEPTWRPISSKIDGFALPVGEHGHESGYRGGYVAALFVADHRVKDGHIGEERQLGNLLVGLFGVLLVHVEHGVAERPEEISGDVGHG